MAAACPDCERSYGPGAPCQCATPATARAPLDEVAAALRALGVHAQIEYPDSICIRPADGSLWIAGTVNGPWGVDTYATAEAAMLGVVADSVETAIAGESDDVAAIAEALLQAMDVDEAACVTCDGGLAMSDTCDRCGSTHCPDCDPCD